MSDRSGWWGYFPTTRPLAPPLLPAASASAAIPVKAAPVRPAAVQLPARIPAFKAPPPEFPPLSVQVPVPATLLGSQVSRGAPSTQQASVPVPSVPSPAPQFQTPAAPSPTQALPVTPCAYRDVRLTDPTRHRNVEARAFVGAGEQPRDKAAPPKARPKLAPPPALAEPELASVLPGRARSASAWLRTPKPKPEPAPAPEPAIDDEVVEVVDSEPEDTAAAAAAAEPSGLAALAEAGWSVRATRGSSNNGP